MLTGATLTQAKEAAAGAEESSYSRRSFKARAVSRKQSRFSLGCSVMYRVKLKQLEIFNFFLSCHTLSLAPSIEVSDTPAGSSTSFYAPASTFACVSRTLEVVLSLNETRRSPMTIEIACPLWDGRFLVWSDPTQLFEPQITHQQALQSRAGTSHALQQRSGFDVGKKDSLLKTAIPLMSLCALRTSPRN